MTNNLMKTHALSNRKMAACSHSDSLAAALRLAVLHDFDEGIDNHFTVAVPRHEDQLQPQS